MFDAEQLDPGLIEAWVQQSVIRSSWLSVAQIEDPTQTLREAGLILTPDQMWQVLEALRSGRAQPLFQGVARDLRYAETLLGFVAQGTRETNREMFEVAVAGAAARTLGGLAGGLDLAACEWSGRKRKA